MTARRKTLPPAALCALLAAVGGLIGGSTAVHGLKQNGYGPAGSTAIAGRFSEQADADQDAGAATECGGCSERDLGYRWATMAELRTPDQCPHDSWGFRRGCLEYTGGS